MKKRKVGKEARAQLHRLLDVCIDRQNKGLYTTFNFGGHDMRAKVFCYGEDLEKVTAPDVISCLSNDVKILSEIAKTIEDALEEDKAHE